jgi:cyclic pyranopterin phosphate synthase
MLREIAMNPTPSTILDTRGRPLRSVRISLTDRCNLRCNYCMPRWKFGPDYPYLSQAAQLTRDEIVRLIFVLASLGVDKVRFTGGEPLLRDDVGDIIEAVYQLPKPPRIALSTNGILLDRWAATLRKAGLSSINLSLDSLDDADFGLINGLGRPVKSVLRGIDAALEQGISLKINAVIQRGINESAILPLARYCDKLGLSLRFIEYMDVGNCNNWSPEQVVPWHEVKQWLDREYHLTPTQPDEPGQTARYFRCRHTGFKVGFINAITQPFCGDCNRLRVSSDGKLYTCLFAHNGFDLRPLLRNQAGDEALRNTLAALWFKRTDRYSEERFIKELPTHADKAEMSYLGG